MSSYYPYDNICAPQYVNFLSNSLLEDRDGSSFFDSANSTLHTVPPIMSNSTPIRGKPTETDFEVADESMLIEDEDKTITPGKNLSTISVGCSAVEDPDPEIKLSVALSKVTLSHEISKDFPHPFQPSCSDISSSAPIPQQKVWKTSEQPRKFSGVGFVQNAGTSSDYANKRSLRHPEKKDAMNAAERNIFKRMRSPVPSGVQDYSLPPEKYFSTSKRTSKQHQNHLPSSPLSFEVTPVGKPSVKKGAPCHSENSNINTISNNPCSDPRIRVGRRPAPIVKQFHNFDYKRNMISDSSVLQPKEFNAGNNARSRRLCFSRADLKTQTNVQVKARDLKPRPSILETVKENHPNSKENQNASLRSGHTGMSCKSMELFAKPFVPKKSSKQPTRPVNFTLHTEQRAYKREQFEKEKDKRKRENDLIRQMRYNAEQRELSAKITQLRKNLVHKARPAPLFCPYEIKKSSKPLCEPETPKCFKKC